MENNEVYEYLKYKKRYLKLKKLQRTQSGGTKERIALSVAIKENNLEEAKRIIEGSDDKEKLVNTTYQGILPLVSSVLTNNKEMAELLINNGAKIVDFAIETAKREGFDELKSFLISKREETERGGIEEREEIEREMRERERERELRERREFEEARRRREMEIEEQKRREFEEAERREMQAKAKKGNVVRLYSPLPDRKLYPITRLLSEDELPVLYRFPSHEDAPPSTKMYLPVEEERHYRNIISSLTGKIKTIQTLMAGRDVKDESNEDKIRMLDDERREAMSKLQEVLEKKIKNKELSDNILVSTDEREKVTEWWKDIGTNKLINTLLADITVHLDELDLPWENKERHIPREMKRVFNALRRIYLFSIVSKEEDLNSYLDIVHDADGTPMNKFEILKLVVLKITGHEFEGTTKEEITERVVIQFLFELVYIHFMNHIYDY